MASYLYTARDQQGVVQSGHLDALNEDEVVAMLQHRGLLVTSILQRDLQRAPSATALIRRKHGRRMHSGVKVDDHVLLCQQLATLIEAGVPLIKALEVVGMQVESQQLLQALEATRKEVEGGRTLHDALAKHPRIFHGLWLNLVETGEASGHLAQSLQQLAHHFESAQHLQNETKTALTYPIFLLCAAGVVLLLFVYVIIPKFTGIFASMNVELPLLTRIVIGGSNWARRYVLFLAAGVAVVAYLTRRYFQTESGQWMLHRAVLRIPVMKDVFSAVHLAEFSRGLSTLLESGVPLLSSLEIMSNSATNKVYGRAIGMIREYVKEGKPMAEPMTESGLFPPMAVQMVLVGEEVGELGKMINRVARYYEERVETFIARMTRLFEPVAIVVIGAIVLFIVLSIFMPIFKMATSVRA